MDNFYFCSAWGNCGACATLTGTCSPGTATSPFGFAGGYTDQTGLVYFVHRYYDPMLREFISVDPAVATTGTPYAYVGNNPANWADPSGLCNPNPFSGSFWSSGNCVSGLVGGPDGGGGESVGGVIKSVGGLAAGVGAATAVGVATAALGGADIPVLATIGGGKTITAGVAGASDTMIWTAGYEVTAVDVGWALSAVGGGAQTLADCLNGLNATCGWDIATIVVSIVTGLPDFPGSELGKALLGLIGIIPSPCDSSAACWQP
ncbi:MAG: RHS repeat-associated core domain-containing protein [Acidimicrobiales bacterium]